MSPSGEDFINHTRALDWLQMSHNYISAARRLIQEKHAADLVVRLIHQSIGQSLIAVYANVGLDIPANRSIVTLYQFAATKIEELNNIDHNSLKSLDEFCEENQGPVSPYALPEKTDIQKWYMLTVNVHAMVWHFITKL